MTLAQALTKSTERTALAPLAQGLAVVATRLEARDAEEAAKTLTQAMTTARDPLLWHALAQGLAAVAARLEARDAREVATTLTQAMSKTPSVGVLQELAQSLATVLTKETKEQRQLRIRSATAVFAPALPPTWGPVVPAGLLAVLEPVPEPLPPQLLVDLLKQPLCVGEARRLVLEQLARHYQRPFADQWDFVRFAQEQGLELDFTTPPKRPALDTDMAK